MVRFNGDVMIIVYHEPNNMIEVSGVSYMKEVLYYCGDTKPHYSVPAIPLIVKYDYVGCVNIDDVSNPDDPIIVYMWDNWNKTNL
jgi:hypothetical protein